MQFDKNLDETCSNRLMGDASSADLRDQHQQSAGARPTLAVTISLLRLKTNTQP